MADEVRLLTDRENRFLVNLGVIIQGATATTGMAASKEAYRAFEKLLDEFRGD